LGKINRTYDKEFKLRAVRMYLEEHKGYRIVTRELGLSDTKMIRRWVKNFRELGVDGLDDRRGRATSSNQRRSRTETLSKDKELERLRAENAYLKKLLELERRDATSTSSSNPFSN
jgi:transposase